MSTNNIPADERAKIVEKIRALFNLGDKSRNSSQEESLVAIRKAQELLKKYNLSLADVKPSDNVHQKKDPWTKEKKVVAGGAKRQHFAIFEKWLAGAMELLCGVSAIYFTNRHMYGRKSVHLVFIGDIADVAIAEHIYNALLEDLRKGARRALGQGWTPSHRCYAEGFASAIWGRCDAEAKRTKASNLPDDQKYAMVLQTKEAWLSAVVRSMVGETTQSCSKQKGERDDLATLLGQRDGQKADLAKDHRLKGGDVDEEAEKQTQLAGRT